MTFNDFLKEEELNRDSLCNILMECANHNCELSKALAKAEVQKIPITILKQFIQAYQDSSVNLKTGKIISPAINLKTIKINQSQKATVTITCENLPRKRFVNAEIYLIALNRFHEYSFDIHRRSSVHAGFWLKENEIKEVKKFSAFIPWKHCQKTQTFEINFSELASSVTEILVCAFVPQGFKLEKGNYDNFKITTNLWTGDSETPSTQELDITTKMSRFGGIHAFSLVKDINEWKTVPFDHILNGHPEEFMESLGKDLYHLNYD